MTEPIEQKLLRLAEAATPAFVMFQKALGATGLSADAALIAALDPATVSRLARVVAECRAWMELLYPKDIFGPDGLYKNFQKRDADEDDPGFAATKRVWEAYRALDATPEGGK